MKFLHTSDLHLGLRLCEASLNEEIAAALGEITEIAEREGCSAVIAAGDLYDRANPTPEAVRIFDAFVTGLARRGIRFLAVSGNHDSPERVGYLSALLAESGAYFSPVYDGTVRPVTLRDGETEADFWLLPFFRPVEFRAAVQDSEADGYSDTAAEAIRRMDPDPGRVNILVAHHFAASGGPQDTAGTVGRVDPAVYAPFDYVALGHLHRAHSVSRPSVRYSGSPVKCSFDEAEDEKSVTVVTIGAEGIEEIRPVLLHPKRDLREIRGSYDELLSPAVRNAGNPEDYLRIILTDEEDIPDAAAKLRTAYPNLLRLSYDNLRTRSLGGEAFRKSEVPEDAVTPEAVFAELWERQMGAPPDEEVRKLTEELFRAAREGVWHETD